MSNSERPKAGEVETRHHEIATEGRKIRGIVPFGIESRDMGGWREVIEPTALRGAKLDELIARVDHQGVPIGRFPKTLDVEEKRDGLHWAVTPPDSRSDLLEAIERGDLQAGSWQMVVGRDRWDGDTRHVEAIAELRDVSVVSHPAYEASRVEYRAAPTPEDAPEKVNSDMSQEQVEERTDAPEQTEERTAPEVKVMNEPEPVSELRVEDRASLPLAQSLTDAFKREGWPAETATIDFGEYRAVTWGGTIDALQRQQAVGVPLGADVRYAWQAVPNVAVNAGVTSVEVVQQTARSLPAGTAIVRDVAETSAKPEVSSTVNILNVPLNQVAGVQTDIPNVYLEKDVISTVVENDLRLAVNEGLDELVRAGLADSGNQAPFTDPLLVSVRKSMSTLQASGYSPDTLLLRPQDSEALDVLVTGATDADNDYVFGAGRFAPGSLFGLRVVVSKVLASPVVLDSTANGKLYVSPITLARFEQDAGATNQSTVRLEGHAAYGVERTDAAIRIAAS